MTPDYSPDDLLPLSGIQHFCFCRRQWALIHIENQWRENVLTVEGRQLHRRVNDPYFTEVRKGVITARYMPVVSYRLGLTGICDVVEFIETPGGVHIHGRQGTWLAAPVEYKRGHKKREPVDEVQLCAQAICLEEMLSLQIPKGYLYYGETRHRVDVELTSELRTLVEDMAREMHSYLERKHTPKVKPSKACRSCSLVDICLPVLMEGALAASTYIRKHLEED